MRGRSSAQLKALYAACDQQQAKIGRGQAERVPTASYLMPELKESRKAKIRKALRKAKGRKPWLPDISKMETGAYQEECRRALQDLKARQQAPIGRQSARGETDRDRRKRERSRPRCQLSRAAKRSISRRRKRAKKELDGGSRVY